MPKVTAPLFSLEAHKTLGKTLTFQKRAAGNVVYLASKPGAISPFTPSTSQNNQRQAIKNLVSSWQALPEMYKSLWNDEALKEGYHGTGYHLFVHTGGALGLTYYWASAFVLWSDPDISWLGN